MRIDFFKIQKCLGIIINLFDGDFHYLRVE